MTRALVYLRRAICDYREVCKLQVLSTVRRDRARRATEVARSEIERWELRSTLAEQFGAHDLLEPAEVYAAWLRERLATHAFVVESAQTCIDEADAVLVALRVDLEEDIAPLRGTPDELAFPRVEDIDTADAERELAERDAEVEEAAEASGLAAGMRGIEAEFAAWEAKQGVVTTRAVDGEN